MKHIINAALIVLAVIFFSGCEFRDGLDEPRFTESTSFVQGYYCPTDNKMEALPQSYGTISVGCGEGGKLYKYFYGAFDTIGSVNWTRYYEKCMSFSDWGYDTLYYNFSSGLGPAFSYQYFAEEIRKVNITYSLDWSETYPTGSELGEIFTLYSISPLEYIRRGYRDRNLCSEHPDRDILAIMQKLNLCDMWVGTVGSDGEYDMECYWPADEQTLFTNFYGEPVVCKVSELTEDALRLTGGGEGMDGKCILFLLKPDYLPEKLNGTLTITVTTNMNTYSIPFKALADLT